jgi:cytoskeletal protein CcmA (bactofilin family)
VSVRGGIRVNQETGKVRDLKISGTASSNGGVFRNVSIQGEGDVAGNVECGRLKVMGNLNIHGELKAKDIRIMGNLELDGNCHCEEMKLTGDTKIHGDCSAEAFRVSGGFTIDGLLNAGKIDIRLYGPGKVTEIGGDNIRVKLPFRVFSGYKTLTADVIEGDEIHIEQTKAKVVRGNKVFVGNGCEIELVEYKEDFQQTNKAVIGKTAKI